MMSSPSDTIDLLLRRLPADLTPLYDMATIAPQKFTTGNSIQRLTITLLNEVDTRISDQDTKLGVLVVFSILARNSPTTKRFMRMIIQNYKDWFDEELDDVKKGEHLPIEAVKILVIRHYAASQFQAIIRGFLDRIRVRRNLKEAAKNHNIAVTAWSIEKIQKVARGYIARRAIAKSRAVRNNLSKDVLRLAERYLIKGDLWGFLREVDDELKRARGEAQDVRQEEDAMAERFVKEVVELRQKQFNEAWLKFPEAVAKFSGQSQGKLGDSSTVQRQTLLLQDPTSKELSVHRNDKTSHRNVFSSNSSINRSVQNTAIAPISSLPSPTRSVSSASHENQVPLSSSSSVNSSSVSNIGTVISDVQSYDPSLSTSLPGPLLRHAVSATVSGEVQRQLESLLSGPHKSKQLLQDMKSAYSTAPASVSSVKSSSKASPPKRRKKKLIVDSDGKLVELQGQMGAAHSDWLSQNGSNSISSTTQSAEVQPGISLLIDVPQGAEDSIERVLHAAALRCYVPEFFRGPASSGDNDGEGKGSRNVNEDADYAYNMYLQLPQGLAKMKYELECKKWSQGPINRLKIKGLVYLPDALPVSRFVMSLRSVDTPKKLELKAVEIVSMLLRMGKPVKGLSDKHAANQLKGKTLEDDEVFPVREKRLKNVQVEERGAGEEDIPSKEASSSSDFSEQLLLSMLDQGGSSSSTWCSLSASVEDLFLQAAFLVVPHNDEGTDTVTKGDKEEMGNSAFRAFCSWVTTLTSEVEKREAIRRRFRASFILVTPFCLHLKNIHHIHTVKQLLAKGLGKDTIGEEIPIELFTQLEILLGQVVGRCVAAKTVPVPRAQQVRAPDMFTVPMIYDPKFQRSPFDPFGKPPRLQVRGKFNQNRDREENGAGIVEDEAKGNSLRPFPSSQSISSDLTESASLWGTSAIGLSPEGKKSSATNDPQWTFQTLLKKKGGQGSIAEDTSSVASMSSETHVSVLSPDLRKSAHLGDQNNSSNSSIADVDSIEERDRIDLMTLNLEQQLTSSNESGLPQLPIYRVLDPLDNRIGSPSLRITSYNPTAAEKVRALSRRRNVRIESPANSHSLKTIRNKSNDDKVEQPYIGGGVEAQVYRNTFKCTYPQCNQVFSRAYTYKIHLRSHETFSQYHEFKKKPQLVLDPDKRQGKQLSDAIYSRKISLPPLIQSDLDSIQ